MIEDDVAGRRLNFKIYFNIFLNYFLMAYILLSVLVIGLQNGLPVFKGKNKVLAFLWVKILFDCFMLLSVQGRYEHL